MAITYQVIYEHDAAEAHIDLTTNNLKVMWHFPGKVVHRTTGGAAGEGKVIDLNKTYRTFSGSSTLTAVNFKEMDTQIRPAAAPTYTGLYPRLTVVNLGAGQSWTMVEVVCTGFSGSMRGDGQWDVMFEFTEKLT